MVITGIGAVTPIGHGADGLWRGVLANRSAARTIDRKSKNGTAPSFW